MRIESVERGKLRPVKFEYRLSPTATGNVLLWLILDDYWGGNDDDEPGWQAIASFSAEMPICDSIIPSIVDLWFKCGCHELQQVDIEEMSLKRVLFEADQENKTWDRMRAQKFGEVLIGDDNRTHF